MRTHEKPISAQVPPAEVCFHASSPLAFLCFVLFAVLGLELRAFILSHSTSLIFVIGFFEIGSHKLFAQAGFKLQCS
jgi:hypothetical protein